MRAWPSGAIARLRSAPERFPGAVGSVTATVLPVPVEQEGAELKIHCTAGLDWIERAAQRIPESIQDLHQRASIATVAMAYLMLAAIALVLVVAAGDAILSAITAPSVSEESVASQPAGGSVVHLVGGLVVVLVFIYALYLAAFLFLLPSTVFHELGHAIAAANVGVPLESYGIALKGPVPTGAFVKPDWPDNWQAIPLENQLWLVSAGVFTELSVACLSAALSLVATGMVKTALQLHTLAVVLMVLVNSLPAGGLDGDYYLSFLLIHWWDWDFSELRWRGGRA